MMRITKSRFVQSMSAFQPFPGQDLPEIAMVGKSNVGKSSMINKLTNIGGLARISSAPGKTRLINLFDLNDEIILVDLPGYGFAKRSKTERQKLENMIRGYILQRQQLCNVFVLIDIRHDPQAIDVEFIDWLGESSIPFCIVFTKADKLAPTKVKPAAEAWMKHLEERWEELPPYFITSAEKKLGRDEVLNYIEQINKSLKEES